MNGEASGASSPRRRFARVLGRFGDGNGTTLLVCAGLHGNEPAGPLAAERVMARLERDRPPVRGRVVAVTGNRAALVADRRFVDYDLNRCWTPKHVAELRERDPGRDDRSEDGDMRAIIGVIDQAVADRGPLSVLDLHTTSGKSPPFCIIGDTMRNRRLAFSIPGPVVLGLEETIDGTLIGYLDALGHTALVVEAGQHADPAAVDLHEAVIWLTIHSAGLLAREEIPDFATWQRRLAQACDGLPRVVEVRYRHPVAPNNGFRMKPGYEGFDVVSAGDVLAHDANGEVRVPRKGHVLMPLYQDQGTDGFFLVQPVRRFWLGLSRVLRWLRLPALLPLLPGVRAHPERMFTLAVNRRVARWFPIQVFHLLGYRRRRSDTSDLLFTRRRG